MNIFDIVFPILCVGCRKEGSYICGECSKQLVVPEPICPMCGMASLDGYTHLRCKTHIGMDRLIVGLRYKGLIQKCLKKIKYKNAWEMLANIFDLVLLPNFHNCLIVPVPMWGPKELERGFNQATIIAELLNSRKCNNSELAGVLERNRNTKPMYGLKKTERQQNIKLAFEIGKGVPLNILTDRKVLLVDDVWTTGATMGECAKILKRNGAKSVWGLVLAR